MKKRGGLPSGREFSDNRQVEGGGAAKRYPTKKKGRLANYLGGRELSYLARGNAEKVVVVNEKKGKGELTSRGSRPLSEAEHKEQTAKKKKRGTFVHYPLWGKRHLGSIEGRKRGRTFSEGERKDTILSYQKGKNDAQIREGVRGC